MTDAQAITLYEKVTGECIAGLDDPEVHDIVDSVRRTRVASSEAEAISAIGHLVHGSQDGVMRVIDGIKGESVL
jgi:hypothetical protein